MFDKLIEKNQLKQVIHSPCIHSKVYRDSYKDFQAKSEKVFSVHFALGTGYSLEHKAYWNTSLFNTYSSSLSDTAQGGGKVLMIVLIWPCLGL